MLRVRTLFSPLLLVVGVVNVLAAFVVGVVVTFTVLPASHSVRELRHFCDMGIVAVLSRCQLVGGDSLSLFDAESAMQSTLIHRSQSSVKRVIFHCCHVSFPSYL